MKRIIVDYSKLTSEMLDLLVEKFPDGYDSDDVMTFKNAKGETVKAVEIRTDDTIYLIKISVKLEQRMEDYETDDEAETIEVSNEDDFPDEY